MFKAADSLPEQIARQLAARIIRGELVARQHLAESWVCQELSASRGPVREAMQMLARWQLVEIIPFRGAQVSQLTAAHVRGLYALVNPLYRLLASQLLSAWQRNEQLEAFTEIATQLAAAQQRNDIEAFVTHSFAILNAVYPIIDNPYLQSALENIQPVLARTYFLAIEHRRSEMDCFLATFNALLQAVQRRDEEAACALLGDYCQHNCALVLAALAQAGGDAA